MLSRNISQTCNDHPSTTSIYRSDFEAPYAPYSRRSSLSPAPSLPTPTPWSGNTTSNNDTISRHDNALYSVLKNPRVTKAIPSHHRNHHHPHHPSTESLSNGLDHSQSYNGSRSTFRSSPYYTPRSNRLPSVIDRMKADLKNPNRSSTPHNNYDRHSPLSPSHSQRSFSSDPAEYVDGPLQSPSAPSPFALRCNEVRQRAYSGQSSQMKKSFDRLQRMDSGKVEYRTVAFCTHLTVSRWEPIVPTPDAETASENASAVSASTTSHAARLMSLANYIRHILSLTVAVPNAQPQAHARQQQVKDEPRNQDSNKLSSNSSSGSTASSSGPGPIKSESNRRHRFSPAYHNHPARRSTYHSERGSSSSQYHSEYPGYREENYASESRETSPNYPRASYDASHTQQPTSILPPLLKIPYPNLTLTLALIYVDRLKAKYPEVKGEPGCSHRLFLVAFIIAAKYRCSVELSPPVPQDLDGVDQEQEIGSYRNNPDGEEIEDDGRLNQSLDARLNAELIFSNHAWVRLLNLGSFYRQSSADTAASSSSATENREQSSSTQSSAQAIESLPPLSSIINNAASSPITGMLQVEDLDRMEAEFLTFLKLDLATMSHDLETCWNLLVGKSEAQL